MEIQDNLSLGINGCLALGREILEDNWLTYLLLSPVLLFLIFLMWLPFLRGVWMSFHSWPFLGEPEWVGLGNYRYLLSWGPFLTGFRATIIFALITVFQLAIALTAALIATNISRLKWLVMGIFLIPYTMPPVVTGNIWRFILHPDYGLVFHYLISFGIIDQPIYWSSNGELAMIGVMFAGTWTFWPFMFLILVATLDNIPAQHYESARVFGANRFQTLTRITLPQLKTAILIVVSLRVIWNLAKVSQIIQMTDGGPGYDTSVLAVLLYRMGINSGTLGQAYAVGLVLLGLILAFIFLFIREFERAAGEVGR